MALLRQLSKRLNLSMAASLSGPNQQGLIGMPACAAVTKCCDDVRMKQLLLELNVLFPATFCLGSGGGSSGESAPAMSVLANQVAAVIPDKWKKVAVQLELSRGDIRAIQKDEDDSSDRFMAVMDHWKQSLSKPFTWATLVSALRSPYVNETRLADELNRKFC